MFANYKINMNWKNFGDQNIQQCTQVIKNREASICDLPQLLVFEFQWMWETNSVALSVVLKTLSMPVKVFCYLLIFKEGGSFTCYFDKNIYFFPLSSCQYVSTILGKNCILLTFQKWTFCKGLYRKNNIPSI